MIDIKEMARRAKTAAAELRAAPVTQRDKAILDMVEKLRQAKEELFEANRLDADEAVKKGISDAFLHRLLVTEKVFNYIVNRLKEAAALPNPVGRVLDGRTMPSGLRVTKVTVPLGVVGIIYEARPNVTTDAAAVALKSANAVILKGSSECLRSNAVLAKAMRSALSDAGLPADAVQFIDSGDHHCVEELLQQDKFIDVIIPRGGKRLIEAVAAGTRIPVLKHYNGICHQYVAASADPEMAEAVVVNSKTQRVEVCNALETLLVDRKIAPVFLPRIAAKFKSLGVELRGCGKCLELVPELVPAAEEDWETEYLAPILSVKIVDGVREAVAHIARYGSGHTDGIITNDLAESRLFVTMVDSASVLVNASTRLSGGGDYGMGAVVGISTGKLHARGPVGPEELCSYKWIAEGKGQLR